MLFFGESEKVPTIWDIAVMTEFGAESLTTPPGEGEWDLSERILRANPSWAYRLNYPSPERVIALSHLFVKNSFYEKAYWKGVSCCIGLNEEIIRCFPAPIIVGTSGWDVTLSDEAYRIIEKFILEAWAVSRNLDSSPFIVWFNYAAKAAA